MKRIFNKKNMKILSALALTVLMVLMAVPMEAINQGMNKGGNGMIKEESGGATIAPAKPQAKRPRSTGPMVLVSEVMFDPHGPDAGAEWAILYNNGSEPQDLAGWTLSNSDGEADALLPEVSLPSDAALYVHFGQTDEGADLDFGDNIGHFYTNNNFEIFDNEADALALFSGPAAEENLVDYIGWAVPAMSDWTGGTAGYWAVKNGLMEANDLLVAEFSEGASIGCKRLDPNSASGPMWEQGKLVINEVQFRTSDGHDKVEIRNPTAATVGGEGWNLKIDSGGEYTLPEVDLEPKSMVVLHFELDVQTRGENERAGINDTDLTGGVLNHYYLVTSDVLSTESAIGLYSPDGIVDYVAWGLAGTGDVTDDALSAGIWTGGEFIDAAFTLDDSIGRDQLSTDANGASDWGVAGGSFSNGPTIGMQNSYSIMIFEANLSADAGQEWLSVTNFGNDLNVSGWTVYNKNEEAVATLPALIIPAFTSFYIHLGVGNEDLDFSDGEGHWYLNGSGGTVPTSKLFDAELDIILITTGELVGTAVVELDIWMGDGLQSRGSRAWYEDAWEWLKSGAEWLRDKVRDAVEFVREGVIRVSQWLNEKIESMKSWIFRMIREKALTWKLDLGDYLSCTLTVRSLGWKLEIEASTPEVEIPVPGFPVLKVFLQATGKITVVKDCGGMTTAGEVTLTVGVRVGTNIKKIFHLSLSAQIDLTITVGDTNIDDHCDTSTHTGTVTTGLEISVDLVLKAIFKIITPEFTFVDWWWKWNICTFSWTDTKDYECCRAPRIVDSSSSEDHEEPPQEECPVEYEYEIRESYKYKMHTVVNGDDAPHVYDGYATTNNPDWPVINFDPPYYSTPGEPLNPGETGYSYVDIMGPPLENLTPDFKPELELPPEYPDGEKIAAPGNEVTMNFTLSNNVDGIEEFTLTTYINATDNNTLNVTKVERIPTGVVNLSFEVEPWWEIYLINEDGALMFPVSGNLYQIRNVDPENPRRFRVVIKVPENATHGVHDINITTTSALPNYSGKDANTADLNAKLRLGQESVQIIWEEDLENPAVLDDWTYNGDWQWGERTYFPPEGPPADDPAGPNIWATNVSGNDTEDVDSYLYSPFFDLTGYNFVNLRFWHWIYRDQYSGFTGLYVNSSGIWYRLKQWTSYEELRMDNWTYEYLDITPYISDQVQFVFNYQSWDMDRRWGWHLDNLSLMAKGPVGEVLITNVTPLDEAIDGMMRYETGNHQYNVTVRNNGSITYHDLNVGIVPNLMERVPVFKDDFETDKMWESQGNGEGVGWYRLPDANFGPDGGLAACVDAESSMAPAGVPKYSTYTSPVLDLSKAKDPKLTFWENSWIDGGFDKLGLYVSTDGGNTWSSEIWSENRNSGGQWEYVEVSLEGYQSPDFVMRFKFETHGEDVGPIMAIDELKLTGANHRDLGYGVVTVPTLAPGEDVNVTVGWDFAPQGPYELMFYVNCTQDKIRANNYAYKPIVVHNMDAPSFAAPQQDDEISWMVGCKFLAADLANVRKVEFYYQPPDPLGDWYYVGTSYGPDIDLNWTTEWDLRGLDPGRYSLVAGLHDIWGGSSWAGIDVNVSNPEGTIVPDFTCDAAAWDTFQFTDDTTTAATVGDDYPIIGWYWDFGDGADTCVQSPVHVYSSGGVYTVELTVTAWDLSTDTRSIEITVIEPEIIPNFTYKPAEPSTQDIISFNDSSVIQGYDPADLTYSWNFGDGNTATGRNVTHSYSDDGEYNVTMNITFEMMSWEISRAITVLNVGPVAAFNYSIEEGTVTFEDRSSDMDGALLEWHWDFGDGNTSDESDPVHTYAATGNYTVNLEVWDDDDFNASVREIISVSVPVVEVRGTVSGTVTFSDGNPNGTVATVVLVDLDGAETTTETDAGGNYSFANLEYGTYVVWASAKGYMAETETVFVDGDETVDLTLSPAPEGYVEKVITVTPGIVNEIDVEDEEGNVIGKVRVSGNGTMVVRRLDWDSISDIVGASPTGMAALGIFVEIELEELAWINFTTPYDEGAIPENHTEESLKFYYWDVNGGEWVEAENTGVDTEANEIWANVTHLTIFGAFAAEKSPISGDGEDGEDGADGGDGDGDKDAQGIGMETLALVAAVVVLIAAFGAVFFLRSRKSGKGEEGEEMPEEEDEIPEEEEEEMPEDEGEDVTEEGEEMPEDEEGELFEEEDEIPEEEEELFEEEDEIPEEEEELFEEEDEIPDGEKGDEMLEDEEEMPEDEEEELLEDEEEELFEEEGKMLEEGREEEGEEMPEDGEEELFDLEEEEETIGDSDLGAGEEGIEEELDVTPEETIENLDLS